MPEFTRTERDELRALAEKVYHWRVECGAAPTHFCRFQVAASPDRVLALLDALEAAEAERDAANKRVDDMTLALREVFRVANERAMEAWRSRSTVELPAAEARAERAEAALAQAVEHLRVVYPEGQRDGSTVPTFEQTIAARAFLAEHQETPDE